MEGDIGLCVTRAPDFFALNRLEGEHWRVGVVDGDEGQPVGCIAVAERTVFLDGRATRAMYVSDLKVHPHWRGRGAADALTVWARDVCVASGGPDATTFLTILAGNESMERRMPGPRGLPELQRVGTVRTHAISLLWRRRVPTGGVRVTPAQPSDVEEMAALWAEVAPRRQFAPVQQAESLARWIDAAPGLDFSSYRLARRGDGALAGFLGLWDQGSFKQMRVTSYSPRLGAVRTGFNAVAPLVGATRLPPPGGEMRHVTVVHPCIRPDSPDVLRTLLLHAYDELRGRGYSFFMLGLDVADPLARAVRGLFAQRTDIWFCTASLPGRHQPLTLDGRPLHHEIALV